MRSNTKQTESERIVRTASKSRKRQSKNEEIVRTASGKKEAISKTPLCENWPEVEQLKPCKNRPTH